MCSVFGCHGRTTREKNSYGRAEHGIFLHGRTDMDHKSAVHRVVGTLILDHTDNN